MSDNIVFPCPACGTKYSVSPHHAGKKTTCKKCGAAVTVPSPQVANPTIVGGTRTIRRADIDPGASAREEVVDTGGPSPEVDMTGGASVLRKEETVIGAPPTVSAPGTRGPARRPGTAGPRPAPSGRAMPPSAGGPRKKNNMPMMLGIGGGVLALILVVVLVVAFSDGGGGSGGGDGGADGTVAGGTDGGKPQKSADELLLEDMRSKYNNVDALDVNQVLFYYKEARARADKPDFKGMQDQFATYLVKKAPTDAGPEQIADIALMLDDDKNPSAPLLLEKAKSALEGAKKATRKIQKKQPDGSLRNSLEPEPKYKDILIRLGWEHYKYPQEMNLAGEYEIEGAQEYSSYFNFDVPDVYREVEMFPPEVVSKLKEMESAVLERWNALLARDKADGFALMARKAWLRFKLSQDSRAKVNREKGQRSFSPTAMGRDTEDFENIWTYTYHRPFMVYVEKEVGQDKLDERFLESLESKSSLLRHLYDWFEENLINKFNLQRVKPQHNAEQAQREGWPMEIVVLKDKATFEKFVLDVMGTPMPGARAYYSPLDERVMTYDDTTDMSADTQWFNESVLIHETFHLLSDHYAANPMFSRDQMQARPRYANILVQEGLTDSVSGFVREGEGKEAKYQLMTLNHLRLNDFKTIYQILGNKELFRIRDTIECRNYTQVVYKAIDRAREEKFKVNMAWLQNVAMGAYYAAACQMSYFFQNYKEGGKYPYREMWWEYIGLDYQGKINLTSHADNRGIAKFKEVFDIDNDSDWDEIEKKFIEYTLSLDAKDVGKGGEDLSKQDSVVPGIQPPPHEHSYLPAGSEDAALPSRDEEEVLIG